MFFFQRQQEKPTNDDHDSASNADSSSIVGMNITAGGDDKGDHANDRSNDIHNNEDPPSSLSFSTASTTTDAADDNTQRDTIAREASVRPVDQKVLYKGKLGAVGESVRRISLTMGTSMASLQKSTLNLMHHHHQDDDDDNKNNDKSDSPSVANATTTTTATSAPPVDRRHMYKNKIGTIGESFRNFSNTMHESLADLQRSALHLLHYDDGDGNNSNSNTAAKAAAKNKALSHKAKRILEQELSEEELELAASMDYEYLRMKMANDHQGRSISKEETLQYAMPLVLRYLISKKGDAQLALKKVRSTLQFRKELDVAAMMTAFDDADGSDGSNPAASAATEASSKEEIRDKLQYHLKCGKQYVQGYDKEGHATFIFKPRLVQGHDKEWTLKEAVYTMERAIACSAKLHRQKQNKEKENGQQQQEQQQQQQEQQQQQQQHTFPTINAVVDCSGFSAWKHAPPMDIGKQFMLALRNHYAGQVNKIFILDAPKSFLWLWNMVQPFIGSSTKSKIMFVNGKAQKTKILGEYYSVEQASSWMLPGGKQSDEVDIHQYLHETSFDQVHNEE